MTTVDKTLVGDPLMGRFWSIVHGFTAYFAVVAADELGVFDTLADAPASAEELAGRLGADPGRLRSLLGGNVAAGTLVCQDRRFSLTPLASTHLVRGASGYLGPLLRWSPGPWQNWPGLAATVRGAAPVHDVGADGGDFLATLVQATFPAQLRVARTVLAGLDAAPPRHLLDIGAGAAPWTVAVLERYPTTHATVNDLPAVLPLAAEELEQRDLSERATLLAGDYFEVALPGAAFDLVVLGHVCRAEGVEGAASLVSRAAGTLAPGGTLVLTEYLLDDDLTGPPQSQLLGTTMVASTEHGGTFTRSEALGWLTGAGLVPMAELDLAAPTTVLVATRRD